MRGFQGLALPKTPPRCRAVSGIDVDAYGGQPELLRRDQGRTGPHERIDHQITGLQRGQPQALFGESNRIGRGA